MQLAVILPQSQAAVRRYVEESGVPFDILVDDRREVSKAYGVWHRIGLDAWNAARPAAFLVEQSGKIRYSFVGKHQADFPSHETLIAEIDRLGGAKPPGST